LIKHASLVDIRMVQILLGSLQILNSETLGMNPQTLGMNL
jgi:hypothetical protein